MVAESGMSGRNCARTALPAGLSKILGDREDDGGHTLQLLMSCRSLH